MPQRFNGFRLGLFRKIDVRTARISILYVSEADMVSKKFSRIRIGLDGFKAAEGIVFGAVDKGTDRIGSQLSWGAGLEEGGEQFEVLGGVEPLVDMFGIYDDGHAVVDGFDKGISGSGEDSTGLDQFRTGSAPEFPQTCQE